MLARITGLRRLGVDCVILLPEKGDYAKLLEEKGFSVRFFPLNRFFKKNPFPYLKTVWRIYRLLKKERFDIVHCSGIYPNQYALPAARMASIPCLAHVTTDVYNKYDFKMSLLKYSDYVITCSKAVRDHALSYVPALQKKVKFVYSGIVDKISHVYDGIIEGPFQNGENEINYLRLAFNIPADHKVVVQLSEVIPRKGVEYFVEMASIVKKAYPKVKFLVVGKTHDDDYEHNLLAQVRKLGLTQDVVFTGFRNDLELIISLLDVSVLASLAEGLARVIVETQFRGKPIVATDVSGNREAIVNGETGILVPPKDPQAMAQAVLDLLQNPEKGQRMGEKGREFAMANFGVDQHAKRILDIYENFLKKRK